MDAQQLKLYRRWIESPQVTIHVGGNLGPEEVYKLPGDVLRERSTRFRSLMSEIQEVIREGFLSATSPATFDMFVAWLMSAQPRLDEAEKLEVMVRLAIFADMCGVWALSNQAIDLMERQLSNWVWTSWAVNTIYTYVKVERPLRKLMQARVNTILPSGGIVGGGHDIEWKGVLLRHAALGWDQYQASKGGSHAARGRAFSADGCDFHEHPWAESVPDRCQGFKRGCPYQKVDCFPPESAGMEDQTAEGIEEEAQVPEEMEIVEESPQEGTDYVILVEEKPVDEGEEELGILRLGKKDRKRAARAAKTAGDEA